MKTNRIQSIRFVRRPRLIEVTGLLNGNSRTTTRRRALL